MVFRAAYACPEIAAYQTQSGKDANQKMGNCELLKEKIPGGAGFAGHSCSISSNRIGRLREAEIKNRYKRRDKGAKARLNF